MPEQPETSVEEVRAKIQRALEQYYRLEEELQFLEKDRFRVCIFGSARIQQQDPTYQTVYEMAKMLAELRIDVVTGGGPGLMEAANRAFQDADVDDTISIGLPIHLPRSLEQANRHLDIKSEHKRFSSRLDEFMRLSHAVIVAPGGIGTMLELMYVWQLIQVGMIEERSVVLMDRSMWSGLLTWMREQMLGRAFVSPNDFDWVHCADTPQEALAFVKTEVARFRARQEQKPEGAPRAAEATRMIEEIEKKQMD